MIRIAILGDIGAGKSFVSKQFNCPLFNADKEVAEIYKNDRSCYQKIKKALPKYIISDHLDKKFLMKAVLDSKNNLKKISKIVHPIVRNRMNKFLIKNKTKKLVVLDIPLYLENKLNKRGDVLIFVEVYIIQWHLLIEYTNKVHTSEYMNVYIYIRVSLRLT